MFFVFPPLLAAMLAMRVILLFKRGSIADKDVRQCMHLLAPLQLGRV